jgi:cob(I)alamin adenosyltransferase
MAISHEQRMQKKKAVIDGKIDAAQQERGVLVINTGNGKGKSSAAFGVVARTLGHGMKVGVVQFVKGAMATGEKAVFDRFPDLIEFKPMGEGFTWDTQDRSRDIAVARTAWDEVKRMIADPSYAMVIADELNIVLRYDYLPVDEILEALAAKPAMTHVIVTGRNAPQPLIDAADLVTEMTQVKHPFREQNVRAQAGIEF